jgi:SagB-type dehydrogenase family enzyme
MKSASLFGIVALFAVACLVSVAVLAQDAKGPGLPPPKMTGGKPLMEALKARQSTRAYKAQALPVETLSNMLWAGFGVNRPDSGKRTAPTAINCQDIDIYVVMADGAYVYDAKGHQLTPVASGDFRKSSGVQPFTHEAPVHLVYVSDGAKLNARLKEKREVWSACHAGAIGQNVSLFCASEGLGTLFYASIDRAALKTALKLRDDQEIVFAQVVGYPKE